MRAFPARGFAGRGIAIESFESIGD